MKWDSVDRRRALRVEFPFTVHISGFGKNTITTYTENISERGVRVVIKEKPKVSLKVGLEIYVRENPVCCKARIVWVRNKKLEHIANKAVFDIGLEFIKLKQDDILAIRERVEQLDKTIKNKDSLA